MDRFELKVRAQEIRDLIESSQYEKAVEIADTIDWSRAKKPTFLCTISDLYKINKRYDDAIELLQLAYDRYPGGKDILYSLCELYLRTGDTIRAISTYKEFCQVAGNDIRRYILQYKVYVAQEVSLEERIEVLEELKKRNYEEKWAYTLAYLYHRVGLATKCVEECDELISWFGEGKYVDMAMELKMLHQPLDEKQQEMYNHRIDSVISDSRWEGKKNSNAVSGNTESFEPVGDKVEKQENQVSDSTIVMPDIPSSANAGIGEVSALDEAVALSLGHTQVYKGVEQEPDINVKTVDVGAYNTINLQQAIAEGVQEVLENGVTGVMPADEILKQSGDTIVKANTKKIFGFDEKTILESDTKEIPGSEDDEMPPHIDFDRHAWDKAVEEGINEDGFKDSDVSDYTQYLGAVAEKLRGGFRSHRKDKASEESFEEEIEREIEEEKVEEEALSAQPPEQIATVLSQEADGQIRFVVPEAPRLDKQITGQLNIDDVMAEWARMKREHEEKNRKQLREQIRQQTGELFNEFETAALNGVLEALKREADEESRIAREEAAALDSAEILIEGDDNMPAKEIIYEGDIPDAELDLSFSEVEVNSEEYTEGYTVEYSEEYLGEEGTEYEGNDFEGYEEIPSEADEIYDDSAVALDEENRPEPEGEAFEENLEITGEEAAEEATKEDVSEEVATEDSESSNETSEEYGEVEELYEIEENAEEYSEEEPFEEESAQEEVFEETFEEEVFEDEEAADEADEEYYGEPESEVFDIYPNEGDDTVVENRTKMFYEKKHEEKLEQSKKTQADDEDDGEFVRELTKEEKELFGPYIQSKSSRKQLVSLLDRTSMASYSGNIILTGGDGNDIADLATAIMKDIKQTDSNFSGKVARIGGDKLNNKKVATVIKQLASGALIIEKASKMSLETANDLYKSLDQENLGIIVTLIDSERNIAKLLERNPKLDELFTARMNLKPLSADQLADFAKRYAYEKEYSIDEMGMLALQTQIILRQTSTHSVNVVEVREIVDRAISNVRRKSAKHFFDVLLGKRYDEEDMIILGEKDFK